MTLKLISSITLVTAVTASLTGCARHYYPVELQLAAETEKKRCQDLGWVYWASEKKNLRAIVRTTTEGDMYHHLEATEKGLREVTYLRRTYS